MTGDEPRLHQVVTNLLANARTHTPPGTTVTVDARARVGDRRSADGRATTARASRPTCCTHGVRAVRAAATTARTRDADGGAGLGLSLVRRSPRHTGSARRPAPGDTRSRSGFPCAVPANGAVHRCDRPRGHDRTTAGQPTVRTRAAGHGLLVRTTATADAPRDPGRTLPRPGTRPAPDTARRGRATAASAAPARLRRWSGCSSAPPCCTCGGSAASGWANSFYSAAAQAGRSSWKALFFGSSDAANSITVDKPPAALWVDGAVGAALRASSLEHPRAAGARGRRDGRPAVRHGPAYAGSGGAGLLAGAVLALTPVAVLMFRFNNPDALLVLLLVAARLRHAARRRARPAPGGWCSAGALVGFGVPHQDAAGVPGAARRSRWSTCSPRRPRSAGGSRTCSPRSARGRVGRAGGSRSSSCGRRAPALHRRLAEQQHARADPRLQRPRPAHRRRDRQRRRRRRSAPAAGGATGLAAAVRRRDRRPDRRGCCPPRWSCSCAGLWLARRAPRTDRLRGRPRGLGRLAARHRADVQLHGRHLPRLLHGGAGPGDRRAGRHRRRRCSGGAGPRSRPPVLAARRRAHRRLGFVLLDRPPTTSPG